MTYAARGYQYTVEVHCRRCNEVLIDERFQLAGLGPICKAYKVEE